MSKYTKVVTEQGVYKTNLSLEETKKQIEETQGLVSLPPYGKNDKGYVNTEKVTIISKG